LSGLKSEEYTIIFDLEGFRFGPTPAQGPVQGHPVSQNDQIHQDQAIFSLKPCYLGIEHIKIIDQTFNITFFSHPLGGTRFG